MKPDRYPPQEPLSALGAAYQERLFALGADIEGDEHAVGADAYQSIAVHPAEQPSGDVLLFFHGGGWTSGYKEWMSFMAPAFNALGVTFATAGYRLAPQHRFPSGLEDAAAAFAWVVRRIAEWGGDPRRVFIGGHSAGGHYAALLAVTSAWRRELGVDAHAVRGCLPVSGVYRFGPGSGLSVRPRFLGEDESVDADASPILRIEPEATPPFLVTYGSRDFPHLVTQAVEMVDALRAAGVPVETEVLEGCDHFEASIACGAREGGWPARAATWMRGR